MRLYGTYLNVCTSLVYKKMDSYLLDLFILVLAIYKVVSKISQKLDDQ